MQDYFGNAFNSLLRIHFKTIVRSQNAGPKVLLHFNAVIQFVTLLKMVTATVTQLLLVQINCRLDKVIRLQKLSPHSVAFGFDISNFKEMPILPSEWEEIYCPLTALIKP